MVMSRSALSSASRARYKPGEPTGRMDPRYYRPTGVKTLLGHRSMAKLGWVPKITLRELVKEMVEPDCNAARRDDLVKQAGFLVHDHNERDQRRGHRAAC